MLQPFLEAHGVQDLKKGRCDFCGLRTHNGGTIHVEENQDLFLTPKDRHPENQSSEWIICSSFWFSHLAVY